MRKKKDAPAKTRVNELILDSYKTAMEGFAAYFGEAFEFVLHDLTDIDHSIIKIKNGFHSGRKEGAPITDLALSMLEEIRKKGQVKNPYMVYVSQNKYGKPVRSTTMVIFGEKNRAIGLLCINLYLDSPLSALLESFSLVPKSDYVTENFTNDSDELVRRSLEKVKQEVLEDPKVSSSQKNKEIVTILYYQGIFKLKDAVQITAGDLGISKNTVYLHLRSLEEKIGAK